MFEAIRQPKDLMAGLIFILFGGLFLADIWLSGYGLGTVRRMGPGWFPTMVAILLVAIGVSIVLKSFFGHRAEGPTFAWQPLVMVSLALAVFTVLLRLAGVVPSVFLLVMASAAAYRPRNTTPLILGMLALVIALAPPSWWFEYVLPASVVPSVTMIAAWIGVAVMVVGFVLAFEPRQLVKMTLAAVALGLFCGIVFVMLLGLPMPKFGPQLDLIFDPVLISFREQWIDPVTNAIRSVLPGRAR